MTFVNFNICQVTASLRMLYYLLSNGIITNAIIFDLNLLFKVKFQYQLSNGIITNAIIFDLNLLFKGQISTVNISHMVKASAKTTRGDNYRFEHLPQNSIIENVVLFDRDLVFKVKNFKCKYRKNDESQRKVQNVTFVDFNVTLTQVVKYNLQL